jgi:hypothetical protein
VVEKTAIRPADAALEGDGIVEAGVSEKVDDI